MHVRMSVWFHLTDVCHESWWHSETIFVVIATTTRRQFLPHRAVSNENIIYSRRKIMSSFFFTVLRDKNISLLEWTKCTPILPIFLMTCLRFVRWTVRSGRAKIDNLIHTRPKNHHELNNFVGVRLIISGKNNTTYRYT